MKTVIMISGKMGSGKSSTSRELEKRFLFRGFKVKTIKFADIIYEMHDAVGAIAKKYNIFFPKKNGTLLQLLGTEVFRSQDPDVWAKALKDRILSDEDHDTFIVDDLRFKNEFRAFDNIDNLNVIKIRLECPEEIRKERAEGWRENTTHISETDLDTYVKDFDLVIFTDNYDLNQAVQRIMNYIDVHESLGDYTNFYE